MLSTEDSTLPVAQYCVSSALACCFLLKITPFQATISIPFQRECSLQDSILWYDRTNFVSWIRTHSTDTHTKTTNKCFKHGKLHLLQKIEMDKILWEKMYFFIHLPQGSVDQLLSCLPIMYHIKLENIGKAGYWQSDRKECVDLFLRLIPSRDWGILQWKYYYSAMQNWINTLYSVSQIKSAFYDIVI